MLYNVYEQGSHLGHPVFTVTAFGTGRGTWGASVYYGDDSYQWMNPSAAGHGNRIVVSGMELKTGKVYTVKTDVSNQSQYGDRSCSFSDRSRSLTGIKAR